MVWLDLLIEVEVVIVILLNFDVLLVTYRLHGTARWGVVDAFLPVIFGLFYHLSGLFLPLLLSLVLWVGIFRRDLVIDVHSFHNVSFAFFSQDSRGFNLCLVWILLDFIFVLLNINATCHSLSVVATDLAYTKQVMHVKFILWKCLSPIAWNFNGAVALYSRVLAQETAKAVFAAFTLAVVDTESFSTSKLDNFECFVISISKHMVTATGAPELIFELV
jgi:hypothetical protein